MGTNQNYHTNHSVAKKWSFTDMKFHMKEYTGILVVSASFGKLFVTKIQVQYTVNESMSPVNW